MCVVDISLNRPIYLLQNRRISKIVRNSKKINFKIVFNLTCYMLYISMTTCFYNALLTEKGKVSF